jgi:hypothetical protein
MHRYTVSVDDLISGHIDFITEQLHSDSVQASHGLAAYFSMEHAALRDQRQRFSLETSCLKRSAKHY